MWPGYQYQGNDPDGFMDMAELVAVLKQYRKQIKAPVQTNTTVLGVYPKAEGYRVVTNRGEWHCLSLVLASGAFNRANIPPISSALPAHIQQLSALDYRNPSQLATGGVLVVGASATGLQLAREIQQAGHPVTIAVGEHVRMPRQYRGRDVFWWMDRCGLLNKTLDEVDDINRVRQLPSPQLVGSSDHRTLDLNTLTENGAQLVGKLMAVNNGIAQFSGTLANVCKLADLKMKRLLNSFDEWAVCQRRITEFPDPETINPTQLPLTPQLAIDLQEKNISTVLWATGFRPDYSWLHVPVLNKKGQLKHQGGIVDAPGLYAMGLPFMRRHKSSFIYGVSDDARDISDHLVDFLAGRDVPVDSIGQRNTLSL